VVLHTIVLQPVSDAAGEMPHLVSGVNCSSQRQQPHRHPKESPAGCPVQGGHRAVLQQQPLTVRCHSTKVGQVGQPANNY
jgi:hypothetical protein